MTASDVNVRVIIDINKLRRLEEISKEYKSMTESKQTMSSEEHDLGKGDKESLKMTGQGGPSMPSLSSKVLPPDDKLHQLAVDKLKNCSTSLTTSDEDENALKKRDWWNLS